MKRNSGETGHDDRLDARQVRSRRALNTALLSLLQEKPFDRITIREIAARGGTGYATFFRHYPGKEALLEDVAAAEISSMIALILPLVENDGGAEVTRALCTFVAEHLGLWSALLTGGASGIVREEFLRQSEGLPHQVNEAFAWLPADLTITLVTGGVLDVLTWWLGRATERDPEEVAGIIDRLIVRPLIGKAAEQTVA